MFSHLNQVMETSDDAVIVERFVDAAIEQSKRTKTENRAETYLTSDDPRIDFFFKVLEDTNDNVTISLLEESWKHSCLDTLRLIAYLRDIRSGKAIRYQYYVCLYWIYEHHPRTLLQNFNILLDCGYWKDPLQLLIVILFKGRVPSYLFQEEHKVNANKQLIREKKKFDKNSEDESRKHVQKIRANFYKTVKSDLNETLVKFYKDEINKKYEPLFTKKRKVDESDEDDEESTDVKSTVLKERAAHEIDRKHLKELIVRYARDRFNEDKKYRYFHLKFAELIAKQLIDDLANSTGDKKKKISLAAKWAPSLNGHFDKYTLISSSIALQIAKLTREQDASLDEIFTKPIPIATYLARKHYHKNYIVKLREQLKIPEAFMCRKQWDILPYKMVPSKCMQKNRKLFIEHDRERFEQFIKSREKISGATLKPPELVGRAMKLVSSADEELEKELLEKQWISLKDSIKVDSTESCFKSALSVCDVSGSMHGTPMQAAIGLTIMTMSFTDEPWSNICLTFSEEPTFVHFEKNLTLIQKVKKLVGADSGLNTDLSKTFQLILKLAKKNKLKQSEMPKYLFIFTDMEFDEGRCCVCVRLVVIDRGLFSNRTISNPLSFSKIHD